MIILWTDALIFLLFFILIWMLVQAARRPYLRQQWQKAYAHPTRKLALIILLCYASIGLLDSMHYKQHNSNNVVSVLDYLLKPIANSVETSYSAPFAQHLFTKQLRKDQDGNISWFAPKLKSPNHVFGTDKVGIDVLYASIKSIRTGLIIGLLTTFISLPFAIFFGAIAGYYRGLVDDLIQYLYTTLSSVPGVLLITAAILTVDAVVQRHQAMFELMAQRTDMRLLILCSVLGLTSWTSLCRILRGETLKLREQEFVLASKVLGTSNLQIIYKHIVPNLFNIILISIVLDFSGLVLAEAVLSYVGVGVDPAMFSWGNMINSARLEMGREPVIWWSLTGAFVLMFTLVLAANIFADGVRDAFDPKVV